MTTRIVTIATADGSLEGLLAAGAAPGGVSLLLCHPHPQYGGTMHDTVLDIVADALVSRVTSTLRFNFRGVGASTGEYDGGRREIEDVEAAARYLGEECNDAPLWLCGYSFGSAMAWGALRSLAPTRVILIAPPVGPMDYPARPSLSARVDVIYGNEDAFVDTGTLAEWAKTAASNIERHEIAGTDHFFSGCHAELERVIRSLA